MKIGPKIGASRIAVAVAVIAALIIVLSASGCKNASKSSGPREKVTIACAEHMSSALVQVADAKGFFADAGVDVVLERRAFGKLALEVMLQGKADLATVADTPVMFAALNGKKVSIIAAIETASRNMTIIALKDRGITKPGDLKGKRIGVTFGTNADYFLETFLLVNRIDRKLTRIINLSPDAMLDALKSGKVDAVSTWNPNVQVILDALGPRCVVYHGDNFYTETFFLTAVPDYVKQHPEAVKKVLRALVKSEEYIHDNPADARRIAAQFSKLDEAMFAKIWDVFNFRLSLDQSILVSLENQTRWAIRSHLNPDAAIPNYHDFIYPGGLQAVKPEAVRMIR